MLFPTHLVAAALLGRRPEVGVLPAVAGAAVPDLVDKPLAMVGVAELYHTVGHSLLALAVVGTAVALLRPRVGVGLWVGWASHLGLDAAGMVANGRPDDLQFLLWPFVRHAPAVRLPPLEFAVQYVGTPSFFLEVGIWAVFLGLAARDRLAAG